jgi:hypothetical protein
MEMFFSGNQPLYGFIFNKQTTVALLGNGYIVYQSDEFNLKKHLLGIFIFLADIFTIDEIVRITSSSHVVEIALNIISLDT